MTVVFWACVGLLGYAYVFYPVLIALLSRLRSAPMSIGVPPTAATVVLVVHNEGSRISRRIENLLTQEPAGIVGEIIVVSDGSTDNTNEEVRRLADTDGRVRLLIRTGKEGKAAGVNLGVASARCDVIVFADARQSFRPDTLANLLARFADPQVGAVSGEIRFRTISQTNEVAESIGLYWRYEIWIRRSEGRFDSVTGCPGAVYAVRRSLFRPMPIGLVLDDVWVPLHVVMQDRRVVYEETAIAEDDPSVKLEREFARKTRTLAGNLQLVLAEPRIMSPFHNRLWWMFASHKLLRLVGPFALLGAFVSNLGLDGVFYRSALTMQCVFYLTGIVGLAFGTSGKVCKLCGAVKVFLGINVAAAVGVLFALMGRSHILWTRSTSDTAVEK